MRYKLLLLSILTSVGLYANTPTNAEEYINTYAKYAVEDMYEYGIPASITLAQGILESGYGTSRLAEKANNHFGIKCKTDWEGETIYHNDDRRGECFRKYDTAEESFEDHAIFLAERAPYKNLFKLKKTDYKGWARGLKKAGYATNPKYPSLLIKMIEKNNLHRFDTLSKSEVRSLLSEI